LKAQLLGAAGRKNGTSVNLFLKASKKKETEKSGATQTPMPGVLERKNIFNSSHNLAGPTKTKGVTKGKGRRGSLMMPVLNDRIDLIKEKGKRFKGQAGILQTKIKRGAAKGGQKVSGCSV